MTELTAVRVRPVRNLSSAFLISAFVFLFLAVVQAKADTISILPATSGASPLGETGAGGVETTASYYAQRFQIPVDGFAQDLTFFMKPLEGPDGTDFRVLLTETTGTGSSLRPTNVLYESSTLTLAPDASKNIFTSFSRDLAHTPLLANKTYFWILDSFVGFDGVVGNAMVGARNTSSQNSGFFFTNVGAANWPTPIGDRASHFSTASWGTGLNVDMAFSLTYTPVTPPSPHGS